MVKITETTWKNLTGVLIENEKLRVIVLPQLGGKIASLYDKSKEFEVAAQPEKKFYALPKAGDDFSSYDASGLDDAFPNIDSGILEENGKIWNYPDHGEIWNSSFAWVIEDQELLLNFKSMQFPYSYEKRICLEGGSVVLKYKICNTGDVPFPCIWTFHGLVRYEEDMQLLYPEQVTRFENVLESQEVGAVGEHILRKNAHYDFSAVPDKKTKTMVKYYADQKLTEGRCGYRYPKQGVECFLEYDSGKLPYLGVWITAGGYRGDYNCALEPSNGYYDSIKKAEENQALYILQPKGRLEFELRIRLNEVLERF